ncbi:MAG TPA: M81 family metallopeptidase [Kiloniellales bacterium]|nr:M81 family metallopeptidase [Kiloniellales bacterium]
MARLWHEGNSFSPQRTGLAEFQRREWSRGPAALRRYAGTATELGALADFLGARPHWSVEVLRLAAAPPSGPVEAALYRTIADEILAGLAAESFDAVYLSLHGSCIAEDEPEADLALVRRVRAAIGKRPLAVTFDLHANLSPALAPLVDILVGYKTYPHIDMAETATKALALLERTLSGEIRPVVAIAKPGALLFSHAMRTDQGPMAEIEAAAHALESRLGLLDATPFGGFTYGDTPAAGATAAVTADGDRALAQSAAESLAQEIGRRRDRFRVSLPSAAAAVEQAMALEGPVAVLEPGDNPLSGGGADTPGLFREILRRRPAGKVAFAFFFDPALVERCQAAGPGATLPVRLGGRLSDAFGPPIEARARVLRLTDGRFVNDGPMERGLAVDLGPTAVLDVDGIEVVVTSSTAPVNDPGWFRLHAIEPRALRLFGVKAKNHFRAAFGRTFLQLIDCDTPGPSGLDLAALPFRHLPKALLEDHLG